MSAQLERQLAEAAMQMQQLVHAELVEAQKLPKPRPGNKGSNSSDNDELVAAAKVEQRAAPGEQARKGADQAAETSTAAQLATLAQELVAKAPSKRQRQCFQAQAMVTTFGLVGKKLRKSDPGAHLGCEVPLER